MKVLDEAPLNDPAEPAVYSKRDMRILNVVADLSEVFAKSHGAATLPVRDSVLLQVRGAAAFVKYGTNINAVEFRAKEMRRKKFEIRRKDASRAELVAKQHERVEEEVRVLRHI